MDQSPIAAVDSPRSDRLLAVCFDWRRNKRASDVVF